MDYLDFEAPIAEIERELEKHQQQANPTAESAETLRQLKRKLTDTMRSVYSNLTPWQTVQIARHKDRPHTTDYLSLVFDEFVELHGDKLFGDDRAIRVGITLVAPIQKAIARPCRKCGWQPSTSFP